MTTISKRVAASTDDAYDHSPGFKGYSDSTNIWAGKSSGESLVLGARFTSLGIPAGSTINSAQITLTDDQFEGSTHLADIACEDSASPAAFSSGSSPKARTQTTAKLTSQTVTEPSPDSTWQSASFHASVQELVDTYGAIDVAVVIVDGGPATNGAFNHWHSYDTDSTKAPLLDIDYTAGAGGGEAAPGHRMGLMGVGR